MYGKKTSNSGYNPVSPARPVNKPSVTTSSDNDEMCKDPKIDAIFNTHDGTTYAFKGNYYYKLTENAIEHGYPKVIAEGWPGLTGKSPTITAHYRPYNFIVLITLNYMITGNIDAAFTYKNGKTYFFQGSKYWRYSGRQMDGDYPKEISDGFTGIPDNLDAALVWGGNGKIYFYKGTKFWRFDPLKRPPVKSTYPKPLSNWEGVPNSIDAALQYTNGYTYFFKGDKYYRFNDRTFSVCLL